MATGKASERPTSRRDDAGGAHLADSPGATHDGSHGHGHDQNLGAPEGPQRAAPTVVAADSPDQAVVGDHDHGHDHADDHDHADGHDHVHHTGPLGWLAQLFGGHSHGTPTADPALEGSAEGIRAVKVSLAGLAVTAALQLVIVALSGSVALFADTVHNLADALTAIPLWIAFVVGRRRPTRRYTYGYGRAEDVAGLAILLMIALSAVIAGWESVRKLLDPEPISHVWWVMAAGVIGFLGNEAVAIYRIRVGQRIGSAALVADGQHARVDGLTSLAVLFGAAGTLAGFPQSDPIVGLLITVAILFVLRDAAREVWWRLMDAVDPALVEKLEAAAHVPGVQAIDRVRVRWIGHTLHAEANVEVDGSLSTRDGHAIAEEVRHAMLHAAPWLRSVTVHVDPCHHDGRDYHAVTRHHFTTLEE